MPSLSSTLSINLAIRSNVSIGNESKGSMVLVHSLVHFMRRLIFEPQSLNILTLMTILKTLSFIIVPVDDGN